MKHNYLYGRRWTVLLLFFTAIVIYSCRKNTDATAGLKDTLISQAKAWYQRVYPALLSGTRTTLAVDETNGQTDYSQLTQPDWETAGSYTRWGDEVVEAPINSSSGLSIVMQNTSGNINYKKEYSRSSFVLIKKGTDYKAYIMTILADSSYVKGDPNKLALNRYNHRDAAFTGMIIYHTPKGEFRGAFEYQKGRLIARSPVPETVTGNSAYKTQALKVNNKLYSVCTYFYTVTYQYGVEQTRRLTEVICKIVSQADGQGGDLPEEEGGGIDNIPCPGYTSTEDGGFPPPADNPHNPGQQGSGCPTAGGVQEVQEEVVVKEPVTDPCLEKLELKAKAQDAVIASQNNALLQKALAGEPYEYGTEHNLTSWPNGSYLNLSIRTDTQNNTYTSRFTWDSVNGYTVGFTHYHPQGATFSPGDVYTMVKSLTSSTLQAAGSAAVNFYKDNATMTIVTANGNYMMTITDWAAIEAFGNQYSANSASFNDLYRDRTQLYFSNEAALLSMFGNAINLYKSELGSTDFKPIVLNNNNQPVIKLCP
jgi:hypothetical protein